MFDDTVAIVRNQDCVDPSVSISEIFNHDFWGYNLTDQTSHKSYRPLTILTFRMEIKKFGLNAYNMKITNFFLHCVASCVLLIVLNRLFNNINRNVIFLAAILFAVHPVHTEAVAGIVGRAELLSTLCYLIGIWIFLSIIQGNILIAVKIVFWVLNVYI